MEERCLVCGKAIDVSSEVCPHCGYNRTREVEQSPKRSLINLKMIRASDLINNPDMTLVGKFRTLYDKRRTGWPWNDIETALNIMAERGWVPRAMAISDLGGEMCVIMERME